MRVAFLATLAGLGSAALVYAVGVILAHALTPAARRRGSSAALAVRLLPAASALLATLALVVPAFLIHEPARTEERPGTIAALLAAAGLVLAASLLRRTYRAWSATRRVLDEWERSAQPFAVPDTPAPTFRIANAFPVVAVVGVFRPRLFVARSVLHALTPDELHAVMEHEAAHLRARDNVKRWLMACAPSIGWRRAALSLERAWENAAEHEADRGAQGALDLASALVKTARLASGGAHLRIPAAAFHGGGDVARRVHELVAAEARPSDPPAPRRAAMVAAAAALAMLPLAWPTLHRWTEVLIHLP
jgi:Zn-dependent protease with chaperone function